MLKITRARNGKVVFRVIGRMDSDNLPELETLVSAETEGQNIALDLSELTLVNEDAVRFLESCETSGIELKNCPAYIREWIKRERAGR